MKEPKEESIMHKTKLISSILLIAAVLFAQVGVVGAASPSQETTAVTGTIQSITVETDAAGTTVLVTLVDGQGVTQTARFGVDEAVTLGLVTLDPVTGAPVVVNEKIGQTVTIEPEAPAEPVHPISAVLASFFGVDGSVIEQYHLDGFGFGNIAQALWMSKNLNGDASLAGLILEAKKTGDFSAFILPDGSTPENWGQFKKAVSEKKNNLGFVVSGKGNDDDTGTTPGNGKDKDKDKDKDKGKGKP